MTTGTKPRDLVAVGDRLYFNCREGGPNGYGTFGVVRQRHGKICFIVGRLGFANVEFRKGRIQDLGLDLEILDAELTKHPIADVNTFLRAQELAADLRGRHLSSK